jgi:hypothetical protein
MRCLSFSNKKKNFGKKIRTRSLPASRFRAISHWDAMEAPPAASPDIGITLKSRITNNNITNL